MAEEAEQDSKTEQPTDNKVKNAVEKGNVPLSRELMTFGPLLAALILAKLVVENGSGTIEVSLAKLLEDPGGWRLENGSDATTLLGAIFLQAAYVVAPVVALLAAAGLGASMIQNSPSIVFDRIKPELNRISLAKGWKRVFGLQGFVEFLKALFKLAIITVCASLFVAWAKYDVLNAMFAEPISIPKLIFEMSGSLLFAIVLASAVLVGADFAWSRFSWFRQLRMTRQEVKDEHKQMDGDPIIKSRLRSLARDRARKRMIAAVPRATLVIANPTHYAVALRYVRSEGGAPVVLAKGKDLIALKIRQVAEDHGVPVVEDKPLARSLYASVQVDQMIPPEFYKAVAQIILFLMARGGGRVLAR